MAAQSSPLLAVHAVERRSRANGPGTRYVVWFQGCSLGCPGCFNPSTHEPLQASLQALGGLNADPAGADAGPWEADAGPWEADAGPWEADAGPGEADAGPGEADAGPMGVDALVADIAAQGDAIEGVTLSGGEPLEQPDGALALVRAVRQRTALSVVVFSGYALEEIRARPRGPEILECIDVLIDGRYQAAERLGHGLRGSRNQRIHLFTDRYSQAEVEATPEAEIRIDARGQVVLTGVNPLKARSLNK